MDKIINMFKISKPLNWIVTTQLFGPSSLSFYDELGLDGHNGEDYSCYEDTVFSVCDGTILRAGKDSTGGIYIEQVSDYKDRDGRFKMIYYHHKANGKNVKPGNRFLKGQPMAISGNTGKYTTGHHEHFGLKRCDNLGNTLNWDNGYKGAIDPRPYADNDFYKSRADKRYGKAYNMIAETMAYTKYSHLTNEQRMALVYGGWSYEDVANSAMRPNYAWVTKKEMYDGKSFRTLMKKNVDKIII